jgi:hypothetical protein
MSANSFMAASSLYGASCLRFSFLFFFFFFTTLGPFLSSCFHFFTLYRHSPYLESNDQSEHIYQAFKEQVLLKDLGHYFAWSSVDRYWDGPRNGRGRGMAAGKKKTKTFQTENECGIIVQREIWS